MHPKIIVHSLISLDGKIEGFQPEAIGSYYELSAQLNCDTWLIGADTLLEAEHAPNAQVHQKDREDEPLEEIADEEGILIVVPDSRGRIRNWYTHVAGIEARGGVALVSAATPKAHLDYLRERNVPIVEAGADHVDFKSALSELSARYGCKRIRTDSGGVLSNVLLEDKLVAELSLLITPDLIGKKGRGLFRTLGLDDALHLGLLDCLRVGTDLVWLRYRVHY